MSVGGVWLEWWCWKYYGDGGDVVYQSLVRYSRFSSCCCEYHGLCSRFPRVMGADSASSGVGPPLPLMSSRIFLM